MQKTFETHFIFKYRWLILLLLVTITALLVYNALKVEKSYAYFSILPENNKTAKDFKDFKKSFKDEGHNIIIGIEKNNFFSVPFYNDYRNLFYKLKEISGIENTLSIVNAPLLEKDDVHQKFISAKVLDTNFSSQQQLDTQVIKFKKLKIYKNLLYNENFVSIILTLNKEVATTKAREKVINTINLIVQNFQKQTNANTYISGLPYIRTEVSKIISKELGLLIIISGIFLLLAIYFFYKNFIDVFICFIVLFIGILWSIGTIHLMGFKLTVLTAIIPSLIIIIGIPNCIYFINKYRNQLANKKNKSQAIRNMLDSMGIITLFCNLTMAIGFFVFYFTNSQLLKEFGLIASLNICLKFILSYLLIPLLLYYLPLYKKEKKIALNESKQIIFINKFYTFILTHKKKIFIANIILIIISFIGITKITSVSYIIDDIPKENKIVSDLKIFEKKLQGILFLEVIIDTKKKNGALRQLGFLENS